MQLPACRHAEGTISRPCVQGLWRIVSEDSDQFVPGLPPVHRLRDLGDLKQARRRDMAPAFDELHTLGKLFEVAALRRPQRMLTEERNHRPGQIVAATNDELGHVLAMVVVSMVDEDASAAEELLEIFERANATHALRNDKPRQNLVAGLVASSSRAVRLPHEADREASFSVYKTDHPATELDQPFLLVVRTRHVVTVDVLSDDTSSARYTGFSSIWPDAHRVIAGAGGNVCLDSCTLSFSGMSP
jgi:hypothetical protein